MICKVTYWVLQNGSWEKTAHVFNNCNSVLAEDKSSAQIVSDVQGEFSRAFSVDPAAKTRNQENDLMVCTVTATSAKTGEVKSFDFDNVDIIDCRIQGEYLKIKAVQGGTMELENDNKGAENF